MSSGKKDLDPGDEGIFPEWQGIYSGSNWHGRVPIWVFEVLGIDASDISLKQDRVAFKDDAFKMDVKISPGSIILYKKSGKEPILEDWVGKALNDYLGRTADLYGKDGHGGRFLMNFTDLSAKDFNQLEDKSPKEIMLALETQKEDNLQAIREDACRC
jgi:hypothetical protein